MIKSVDMFWFPFFLLTALTSFSSIPSSLFTLRHCTWSRLWPPAQDRPWEWPALNIVVCWKQHGVMWMRPGEVQGFVPYFFFPDVSWSAQQFSAFISWVLKDTVHISVCSQYWEGTWWDEAYYMDGEQHNETCQGLALPLHVQKKNIILQIDCLRLWVTCYILEML